MARAIKFRAWNVLSNKMLKWGDIFTLRAWEVFPGTPEQRPFRVMQYTGLHDETDEEIEIYEEDIIQFNYEGKEFTGVVKFDLGCFIVVSDELAEGYLKLFDIADCDREYCWINGKVLGNTFEKNNT